MKDLRGFLAELSANWLKRRKAPAQGTASPIKTAPRVSHQTTRVRAAYKPKPPASRDLASNM